MTCWRWRATSAIPSASRPRAAAAGAACVWCTARAPCSTRSISQRARPARPSATTRCTWRNSSRIRVITKSRCWPMARATRSNSARATAPCSAATRRWSKRRPRPASQRSSATRSASGHPHPRPCHRVPHQRRGPRDFRALARHRVPLSPRRRARHSRGFAPLFRLHRATLLRLDDWQAHRLRRRPRRGARTHAHCAHRDGGRRHQDQHPAASRHPGRHRLPGRRHQHPLSRIEAQDLRQMRRRFAAAAIAMPWIQIIIESLETEADAVGEAMQAAGAVAITLQDAADQAVFQLEPGETPLWSRTQVCGLFDATIDPDQALAELRARLGADAMAQTRVETLPDQDWQRAWMDQFKPLRFGERLWVVPRWHTPPDPAAVNILLDPGLAFGTGTHPTTALCLEWLDSHDLRGRTVIDYGCNTNNHTNTAAVI